MTAPDPTAWQRSTLPLIAAPMAGVSTPELVAAVARAGGYGMLAAGYQTAQDLRDQIERTSSLSPAPFGVNIFTPSTPDRAALVNGVQSFAQLLKPIAAGVDAIVPEPDWDGQLGFDAKVDVVLEAGIELVSFTFGLPPRQTVQRLHDAGVAVMVTVTEPDEALSAGRIGADLLCVQGVQAGGHRGTHRVDAIPSTLGWNQLLGQVRAVTALPVVVAGGIATAHDVRLAMDLGAAAVQCGTAFLLTDEAGTSQAYRDGLTDPDLDVLATTRAFSGRVGRGVRNRFVDLADEQAPPAFPVIDGMTKPMRAAAAAAGDHQLINLWAGTGWRRARTGPAAETVALLTGALDEPGAR